MHKKKKQTKRKEKEKTANVQSSRMKSERRRKRRTKTLQRGPSGKSAPEGMQATWGYTALPSPAVITPEITNTTTG